MDLIIRNGKIVTPSGSYTADVGVKDGQIALIGRGLPEGKEEVDATGLYVLPGAIDAHTHLSMLSNGIMTADDYFAGTRAAACGGTTTIIDYAVQNGNTGIVDSVKSRIEMAQDQACVDYGFHCAIVNLKDGALLDEFQAAADFGITSFKCFMVYKREGLMIDDGQLAKILLKAKETGILTNVHAENPDMLYNLIEQFLAEGNTGAWYHYKSRPEFVEAEADIRAVYWAKKLGAPLYIVHLANEEGLEAVTRAQDEGYPIYAETCPQYLNFTCDVYKYEDGRNFVCSPPMKGEASRQALWRGIRTGHISTIATDHCPYTREQKDLGKDDFTKIPNGCPGIENMYPYMLSAANRGEITFEKAVEVCSANPARLFGCENKGAIRVGADADIVLYDPKKNFTITNDKMHSETDYTIWEGVNLTGYPVKTYSRGRLVYDNGAFTGAPGWGKYIKRKAAKY